MGEFNEKSQKLLKDLILIEGRRVRDLGALIGDRIEQDPGDISVDWSTGQILGALSDAARAARYVLGQRIILKGGEDPGWGR